MNLLFYPELGPGGARRVMDFIERQDEAAALLLSGRPGRVQIRIGQENGHNALAAAAVVSARYSERRGRRRGGGHRPAAHALARTAAQTAYRGERVGEMLTRVLREE